MDNENGDGTDENEEDWLTEGRCSETGNLFQRRGDAYWNERFVTFKEMVGGRSRVPKPPVPGTDVRHSLPTRRPSTTIYMNTFTVSCFSSRESCF